MHEVVGGREIDAGAAALSEMMNQLLELNPGPPPGMRRIKWGENWGEGGVKIG